MVSAACLFLILKKVILRSGYYYLAYDYLIRVQYTLLLLVKLLLG